MREKTAPKGTLEFWKAQKWRENEDCQIKAAELRKKMRCKFFITRFLNKALTSLIVIVLKP